MDTLPLPPRPDIEQYRKRAKSLVTAANSGDRDAINQWATHWIAALTKLLGVEITPFVKDSFDRAVGHLRKRVESRLAEAEGSRLSLADAQHLIAEAHSYDNWAAFAAEIEGLRSDEGKSEFEKAADAVVTGDLPKLDALLSRNPGLVGEKSSRKHHATLLHYVAANGVEDFRQKTPPNAVEVAKRLIAAGADVNALADSYGSDLYQTTMNLLVSSTHPADAGLQSELVEVLLDHGAAINGLEDTGSPILTALAFGYRDAADTLARRGARIDHVAVAAAVGRLDLVRKWVIDRTTLATEHAPYKGPYWVHIPDDPKGQIEWALVWACRFGRTDVARFLLEKGVSASSQDNDRMTALHWASARGMLEIMEILIGHNAPLEVRNTWGGTVVDSTAWFAVNSPMPGVDYPAVIERLLRAGADPDEIYPPVTGLAAIDAVIGRYREVARLSKD
jgi:ankyrin repeat protein